MRGITEYELTQKLPGLPYTQQQLFFIKFAHVR